MQGFSIIFCYYVVNVFAAFGDEVPVLNDVEYLTLVNSISSVFNALRFIWSGAIDKYPFKWIYGFLCVLQICIAFTMKFSSMSRASYMMVVSLSLFTVGGHFALFPNIIRQIYGKQATALYGWCFTSTGLASVLIELLILSPAGNEFILMFFITGGFSVVSLLMLLFV